GVSTNNTTQAALELCKVEPLVNLDPAITLMQQRGDINILVDTRTAADTEEVFGGSYPSATLYAKQSFIEDNPETVQKLVNAFVHTLRWMQDKTAEEIVEYVP